MLAAFEFAYTETLFWAGIYMLPMLIETVILSLIRGSLADKYGAMVFCNTGHGHSCSVTVCPYVEKYLISSLRSIWKAVFFL
jgi:hypothetical protein